MKAHRTAFALLLAGVTLATSCTTKLIVSDDDEAIGVRNCVDVVDVT